MSTTPPQPEPASAPAPPRRRRRAVRRWTVRLLGVGVAVLAGAMVGALRIDLGPAVKALAERQATNYLHRPMHIGHLSVRLGSGVFVLDDVRIEGLTPEARPFLRAKQISVDLPWWSMLSLTPRLTIGAIHMTDWEMVIETFPDGRHNVPKLTPERTGTGPKRFTTVLQGVYAERGRFVYDDHRTPWSIVAPSLAVRVVHAPDGYRGTAAFSGGTVQIEHFEPMRTTMQTRFRLQGALCVLEHINLITDGAQSSLHGTVDFAHWPEQTYYVDSHVDFPRMRRLFFANDHVEFVGTGEFKGLFHLFRDGHELKGDFTSELAGIDTSFGDYRLPHLAGSLDWKPDRFTVSRADSDFYGGRLAQTYTLAPIGTGHPAMARWSTSYQDVDLGSLGAALGWPVLRLAGRATGENTLVWPNGDFGQRTGTGVIAAVPTDGGPLAGTAPDAPSAADVADARAGSSRPDAGQPEARPAAGAGASASQAAGAPFPVGGEIHYRWEPEWLDVDDGSWAATRHTYVAVRGRTAYGDRSDLPFHLASTDWQESDRLLAALLSAFGNPTAPIEVGGRGTFDGRMTRAFKAPRITGRFDSRAMRAWDVGWGRATGDLVIENGYVDVTNGVITGAAPGARLTADGRFSLGYPRADGGEEIDAHVTTTGWPAKDLRHAFLLDDWPVEGAVTADLRLRGQYRGPDGTGTLRLDDATAWGEAFSRATGGLRFEPAGIHVDDVVMDKGSGTIHGAAWVGWDGTYTFNADGERIPVESMTRLTLPQARLTGLLSFQASGTGAFANPEYTVQGSIAGLYAGDEGVGEVAGSLWLRDQTLTLSVNAASPRLSVSGSGRIAMDEESDAEMTFRVVDTSIDPYIRMVAPAFSPYTSARVSGSVRISGELADVSHLLVDTTIDNAQLQLFDYGLHNDGPVRLTLENGIVHVGRLQLAGEDTDVALSGQASLEDRQIALHASGAVNLAILELVAGDVQSRGAATIAADITGDIDDPVFSGSASITDGRLRHFSLPNAIEGLNGEIRFDRSDIRLDGLHAQIGGGPVQFGGRIGLQGYVPHELAVTMHGENVRLRYPEGFQSFVNADLALRGTVQAPTLSGTVTVLRATLTRPFENGAGLLGFVTAAQSAPAPAPAAPAAAAVPAAAFPLTYEVRVVAPPSSVSIVNQNARIYAGADLTFRGTYEKPVLAGRVELDRGDLLFQGNRYVIRSGSIDFTNPTVIEPFFDVEAETRVRVPGQDYRVNVRLTGTRDHFTPEITSDPRLPEIDVLYLLLGENPDVAHAELNAVGSPQEAELNLSRSLATQMLVSPLSEQVGRVFEPLGLDTVQITPLLGNAALTQLNPSARLTIGKRISDRAFLTYSRDLNGAYEVIVLEYDQSERLSWIVSRNEDASFALDVRVRHVF